MNDQDQATRHAALEAAGALYGQDIEGARLAAGEALPSGVWERGSKEIEEIAGDPEQLNTLLGLARIYVDTSKTLANRSIYPRAALGYINEVLRVVEAIYLNPTVQRVLKQTEDVELRKKRPEMTRDLIKTMKSSAPLFGPVKSSSLLTKADQRSKSQIKELKEDDPTRTLMVIEDELQQEYRGRVPNYDIIEVEFDKLVLAERMSNSHRVGTVSMWIAIRSPLLWALGKGELAQKAKEIWRDVLRDNPDYVATLDLGRAQRNLMMQQFKNLVFPLMSLATISPATRQDLYKRLIRWEGVDRGEGAEVV